MVSTSWKETTVHSMPNMSKFIVSPFQQASAQTQRHACYVIWTTSKFKDFPGPRALISRALKIHKKKFCDFPGVLIIWFETVLILPVRLYGHIHIFSLFTIGSLLFILLRKLFCQFTICSSLFIFVAETVLTQPVRLYRIVYMFTIHNLFTVVYICCGNCPDTACETVWTRKYVHRSLYWYGNCFDTASDTVQTCIYVHCSQFVHCCLHICCENCPDATSETV